MLRKRAEHGCVAPGLHVKHAGSQPLTVLATILDVQADTDASSRGESALSGGLPAQHPLADGQDQRCQSHPRAPRQFGPWFSASI